MSVVKYATRLSFKFQRGVHTVTYYVNVYIYREILSYVNVIICDYYISLIYRTENSPMIIGEVDLSVYR